MKPLRILHTADVHFHPDPERRKKALASLKVLAEAAGWRDVIPPVPEEGDYADAIIIAGDLFDGAVRNADRDGFPELQRAIRRLLHVAPVFVVPGTPTHDLAGCYETMVNMYSGYPFVVVEPERYYFLLESGQVATGGIGSGGESPSDARLLIMGCPEPSKGWLLADQTAIGAAEAQGLMGERMRDLFTGYGAVRRDFAEIPSVFLYHGNIRGAVLQNGAPIPDTAFAIGRDELGAVGADYYALGHIHQRQKIGELPAYYPGSAYPVNWGEVDQAQFNRVEIADRREAGDYGTVRYKTTIDSIDYPHLPRLKIEAEVADDHTGWAYANKPEEDITGVDVWLAIEASREIAAKVNAEEALAWLRRCGAGAGSRVTVAAMAVETVRAAEIREISTLADKVAYWADCSGIDPPAPEIVGLCEALEVEARDAGVVSAGARWRLESLGLRGSVGVWKGTGLDEVSINFEAFDPGLVALLGPNGSGKTSLLENMHPYPGMLTRRGSLQTHFRLRDSWRDLYLVDELSGDRWRFYVLIDGQNPSGSCQYLAYRNGEPQTDGRLASYEELVGRLFGSLPLYVQSVFAPQKPIQLRIDGKPVTSDLAAATDAQLRTLCAELLGLHRYRHYAEQAKAARKAIEAELERDRGKREVLEDAAREAQHLEVELVETEKKRAEAGAVRGKRSVALVAAEEAVAAGEKRIRERDELSGKLADGRREQNTIISEDHELAERRNRYERNRGLRAEAEDRRDEQSRMEAETAALRKEKLTLDEARAAALEAYNAESKTFHAAVAESMQQSGEAERERDQHHHALELVLRDLDRLNEQIEQPLEDRCPTCDQVLPEPKLAELRAEKEGQRKEAIELEDKTTALRSDIADDEERLAELAEECAAVEEPQEPAPDLRLVELAQLIEQAERQLARYDASEVDQIIADAIAADAAIIEIDKRRGELSSRNAMLSEELAALQRQLDKYEWTDGALANAQREYENARQALDGAEAILRENEMQAAALTARLEHARGQADKLGELQRQIEDAETGAQRWAYLERAIGEKGVQALELDAAAPAISSAANELLEAAYGPRFAVRFATTKVVGKGSSKRIAESFGISVLDSETGEEQSIDTLSGGEAVWIKKAISDAFALVRARSTGLRFGTVFQDEADGALDPAARERFFAMLEASHEQAGRRHTVVVTHAPEIQARIGQSIDTRELAPAPEGAAV